MVGWRGQNRRHGTGAWRALFFAGRWALVLLVCLVPEGRAKSRGGSRLRLVFTGFIGDLRGKAIDLGSAAVTSDGRVWMLLRSGRLVAFGPGGEYLFSRRVHPGGPADGYRLSVEGERVFAGSLRTDFPALFASERMGAAPGRFRRPRDAAMGGDGRVVVADTGNRRLQWFRSWRLEQLLGATPVPAPPVAVALSPDGKHVAVATEDGRVFAGSAGPLSPAGLREWTRLSGEMGPVRSVALGPDGSVLIGVADQLRRLRRLPDGRIEDAVVAPSWRRSSPGAFVAGTPMRRGPTGRIWYANETTGEVFALDPRTRRPVRCGTGFHRPLCVGFGVKGRILVGGFPSPGQAGPRLAVFDRVPFRSPGRVFPPGGLLYRGTTSPVWDIGTLPDGVLVLRIVEPGYRKGWPALCFKKVAADGRMTEWLDFGPMYAVRRRFAPWEVACATRTAPGGDVYLTATPLQAVLRVSPAGKIIWEVGMLPRGGADRVPFRGPCDLAVDTGGNVWVTDKDLGSIFCLSPAGRLLLRYGGPADIDVLDGSGFGRPTGIETARTRDAESVFVGDAGNGRIAVYRIDRGD
ncbi:MAG: hypothetical protein GXP31_06550 [Kiritimatiellaeota bacterium]|nr:hypothetical protein [Kiritimatiellota bacterium]